MGRLSGGLLVASPAKSVAPVRFTAALPPLAESLRAFREWALEIEVMPEDQPRVLRAMSRKAGDFQQGLRQSLGKLH